MPQVVEVVSYPAFTCTNPRFLLFCLSRPQIAPLARNEKTNEQSATEFLSLDRRSCYKVVYLKLFILKVIDILDGLGPQVC